MKLNLKAVDELLPLVRDLQASIVGIPSLPPLPGVERVAGWLVTLNGMRAGKAMRNKGNPLFFRVFFHVFHLFLYVFKRI